VDQSSLFLFNAKDIIVVNAVYHLSISSVVLEIFALKFHAGTDARTDARTDTCTNTLKTCLRPQYVGKGIKMLNLGLINVHFKKIKKN